MRHCEQSQLFMVVLLMISLLAVWLQAHQEIPDWLEALAAGSYGSGGFTSNRNQFRDLRRGNVGISLMHTNVYSLCMYVYVYLGNKFDIDI